MEIKTVCTNRRARHDYKIMDTVEAGLVLMGSEVKSLRAGHASIKEGYVRFKDGELYLVNATINPYEMAGRFNHEPKRDRKVLLSKREIGRLEKQVDTKGMTLVPLKVYFKGSWAKVEIGIAAGKQTHDKRAAIAEREAKREMDRARKEMNRVR